MLIAYAAPADIFHKETEIKKSIFIAHLMPVTSEEEAQAALDGFRKEYKDATPSYPSGYWYTKLKGGKLIKAKTQEAVYCRLYEIYYGQEDLTV